jgi:hypothetical protein
MLLPTITRQRQLLSALGFSSRNGSLQTAAGAAAAATMSGKPMTEKQQI